MQLFCLPSAGSSASMYNDLKIQLQDFCELIPIELPGHGRRFAEPLKYTMEEIVDDCGRQITKKVNGPYALLGYSMGAWIAYELYYSFLYDKKQLPEHIFICAQEPPTNEAHEKESICKLSDDDFLNRIIELGGIPQELRDPDIMKVFLPILRADYTVIETYKNRIKMKGIECNATILVGKQDEILTKKNNPYLWSKFILGNIKFYEFEGGHFFININTDNISKIIKEDIEK